MTDIDAIRKRDADIGELTHPDMGAPWQRVWNQCEADVRALLAAYDAKCEELARLKPRKCDADMYADPPRDCNAPFCGCNPEWDKTITTLIECGWKNPEELRAIEAERDAAVRERDGLRLAVRELRPFIKPPLTTFRNYYVEEQFYKALRVIDPQLAALAPPTEQTTEQTKVTP